VLALKPLELLPSIESALVFVVAVLSFVRTTPSALATLRTNNRRKKVEIFPKTFLLSSSSQSSDDDRSTVCVLVVVVLNNSCSRSPSR
jgi:hypothetical protein